MKSMTNQNATLKLTPIKIFRFLLCVIGMLISLNLLVLVAKFEFGHPKVFGLAALFTLDLEQNIPTWFSSILILTCSILLAGIGLIKKTNDDKCSFYWGSLAFSFLALSVDEAAGLHELSISPVRNFFNTSGFFYFAWVIPGILLVITCATFYWRFLMSLPRSIMLRMIVSAFIYIGGAIGMELVGGGVRSFGLETEATRSLTYEIVTIIEESLEMMGMAYFMYTLLIYLASQKAGINIVAERRLDRSRNIKKQELRVSHAN